MNIHMAIAALATDISETPFFRFFVAIIASGRQMRSMERKGAAVVLFDGEQGFGKTFCSMT